MTLGIYLIHEHPMMYEHVFSIDWITSCATLSDILVTMALALLIEYVVCFAIETVGKEVIDRALSKVITKELDVTVITEKKNLNEKKVRPKARIYFSESTDQDGFTIGIIILAVQIDVEEL